MATYVIVSQLTPGALKDAGRRSADGESLT